MVHPHRQCSEEGLAPKTLTNLYRCTIESILMGYITAWYCNCTARKRRALQRVVRSAQCITAGTLPALQDTLSTQSMACSLHYHPEGEVSTSASKLGLRDKKQLLSQGHQTATTRLLNPAS